MSNTESQHGNNSANIHMGEIKKKMEQYRSLLATPDFGLQFVTKRYTFFGGIEQFYSFRHQADILKKHL